MTRVGETFGRMTSNIGRMGRRMGVGLTAARVGIFALTTSTAAYGDTVAKTAGKLRIAFEALQEYRFAAEHPSDAICDYCSEWQQERGRCIHWLFMDPEPRPSAHGAWRKSVCKV
ncbi:hypothetical protein [Parasedimentitalea psychrophila]|uniref:Uncharacterized protein n=1 Tax=Parasedimentitalea psychrophila TaxID=2997337 RepID=A0A9Y2P6J1_9RHOB|nr:hypothetical protein [Parasedimentitalea psychrophila]WIY27494.1 hypothetical protein QPJ95_11605 [Parasedimentitalea psychrophila]